MNGAKLWSIALLMFPLAAPCDVFKYVDPAGNVYFTDSPLQGDKYRLEWKRTAAKLVSEHGKKLVAAGSRRLAAPPADPPARDLSVRRVRYSTLIEATARQFNLYPELLHAVVRTESAYNASAVSSAGAIGLMQLMPATAARYHVSDIWNPVENLRGGAEYLRDLLDMFEHDLRLALAAYNAGENAVIKYGNRIPPYAETQHYVRKVLQFLWAERTSAQR
ncbi:MAG: transglycosylase SLT domain-containing protein [Chromatiaceae bacterium]